MEFISIPQDFAVLFFKYLEVLDFPLHHLVLSFGSYSANIAKYASRFISKARSRRYLEIACPDDELCIDKSILMAITENTNLISLAFNDSYYSNSHLAEGAVEAIFEIFDDL